MMWKFFILLVVITNFLIFCESCTDQQHINFQEFKKKFQKNYKTEVLEESALSCYCKADDEIMQHNSDSKHSFKLGHNDRSDICLKVGAGNGLIFNPDNSKQIDFNEKKVKMSSRGGTVILGGLDFRNKTGEVRSQGRCGSCWAVSSISVLQYFLWLKRGKVKELSYSDIVDCNPENFGCTGGDPVAAFNYAYTNGIALESKYPSTEHKESCKRSKNVTAAFKLDQLGVAIKFNGIDDNLQAILDQRGVAVIG